MSTLHTNETEKQHWGLLERIRGGTPPDDSLVQISEEDRKTISILVVDDEHTIRDSCASILRTEGYEVTVAGKADEAVSAVRRKSPDIVLVDLFMPDVSGVDIMEEALDRNPLSIVIVMTGKPSVESSIEVMRAGAWNYLPKPFSATHLNIVVGRAAHAVMVGRESQAAAEEGEAETFGGKVTLLGKSDAFRRVVDAARKVARTDASVFITGESGTGKELIAQFIHNHSRRSSRELVPVNGAAIPESLLESEMFGHVEGSFTGAVQNKEGLLEVANGGTLFLDEITEMPMTIQAKLLRVIQDGVVRRVGSTKTDAVVDVRFIAATNVDAGTAVQEGKLRRDLLYRLRVFPIEIPPLRKRPEDIPVLAEHYLRRFWREHRDPGLPRPRFTPEALNTLEARPWEGNVRELRNAMERAVVTLEPGEEIEVEHLAFLQDTPDWGAREGIEDVFRLDMDYHGAREHVLAEFERRYLHHVITRAQGNISDAARLADVDRTTLYRLMEKHDTSREDLLYGGDD